MVPVVVVGNTLNALGAVRSLARGAVPVYLVTSTWRCAAAWSRHCRIVRRPTLGGPDLLAAVQAVRDRTGERPVLILTGDEEVDAASDLREQLAPLCRLRLPAPEVVRLLEDKGQFQQFAERHALPVPRAAVLSGSGELGAIGALTLPVVVKPALKTPVLHHKVERAVRASALREAQSAAAQMLAVTGKVVVQEWIDGPDTEIYFCLFACDGASRATAMFVGRKVVCAPPAIGNTAYCVAAPEASLELSQVTARLISSVGYQGLGSLEFKRSRTTGRFLIVEPTVGRTDWQEEIAALCGVNVPLAAYCSETGAAMPPTAPPVPSAWRASIAFRAPRGTVAAGTRVYDAHFRLADPLPGVYYYVVDAILKRGLRLARRPFKAMGPVKSTPSKSLDAAR
jgi:predicted ATP-grasp superfamily ATP-dependent carboligase